MIPFLFNKFLLKINSINFSIFVSLKGGSQKIRSNFDPKIFCFSIKLKKIPFRQITFNKKNEEELGEIFTFFVLETILLSRLMNINPFNQPAVEQVKIETRKILR